MPKPPAAFSPLTTTRSSFHSAIRPGSRSYTILRPLRPTTSPMNRIRMRSGPAAVDHVPLGQHKVEPGVARRGRHFGDLLRRIGDADRDDGFHAAQPRDGHVVIAGAVADAV